jgi:hypothetical protein
MNNPYKDIDPALRMQKELQELREQNYILKQAIIPFAVHGMALRERNQSDKVVEGIGPYGSYLLVRDFILATEAMYGPKKSKPITLDEGPDPVCAC